MPNMCLLPPKDSFIDANQADTTFGGATNLYIGAMYLSGSKTGRYRTLLQWDLPAELNSSDFTMAFLVMYHENAVGAAVTSYVHRVTRSWVMTEVTWNKADSLTSWTTPGGDITETGKISFTKPTTVPKWWDVLDITTLVKDAIDSRGRDLNILLKIDAEDPGVNTQSVWRSTSYTEEGGTKSTHRPFLLIVRPPFGRPMML